jgi:hypothetical protein
MDPQTAFFIVSNRRRRGGQMSRQVSPYFDSLQHAVRALSFLRRSFGTGAELHIEQGTSDSSLPR